MLTAMDSGPHGAGLSNMIFARDNATIVEFALRPQVNRAFGHMAMALGHEYWMVPQVAAFHTGGYSFGEDEVKAVIRLLRHLIM